jgi:hypothetical protein
MFISATIHDMSIDVDAPPESFINDRRQDWLTELTPEDYSRCMSLLEEVLGIPYRYSPEATAAALLRHLHNRPGGKRLEVAEMPPPALEPNTETDLHWIRELTAEERRAPFIVAYDVNAAYLAACSSLPLGVGKPEHMGPHVWTGDIHLWSGYFRLSERWVTTPVLSYILKSANLVRSEESWIWPENSRPLEPWYKVLRDARQRLIDWDWDREPWYNPPRDAALQTIKMMYCGFFGRCASTKWDRTGDVLFRPDWRHMVIATRRTRLQRVMAQCDPAPFAAYSDCLYFAVPASPPVQGLRLGTNPGSFKLHGCVQNVDPVYSSIMAGELSRLVELVK